MSAKQDCTYARTAQDIERKYSFGKTFADMLGLINDNRDKVDEVESSLRNEITEQSTSLKRTAEEISMQAAKTVKGELEENIADVDEKVYELSSKVDLKMDAESVNIAIEQEMAKGVDRVVTKTGYEFGADGLNISKSGSEMKNLLDDTGMYVSKSGDNVLVANKDGVKATDLHAKTYLIIGKDEGRSRFEDYGINRTACFWIGG